MKISLAKIPESGIVLEQKEPPQIMADSSEEVGYSNPVHVKVSANLVGRTLIVRGKLSTSASLQCSRCLKEFDYSVEVRDYTFTKEVKGDETVDLTESIREDIILSLI